jgi:hypothetical protein
MRFSISSAVILCSLVAGMFTTRATAQTPVPTPSPPSALSLDEKCSPTTFRPDEWIVLDCIQRVTNNGSEAAAGAYTMVNSFQGNTPSYLNVWSRRGGKYLSLEPGSTTYPPFDVGPGETSETETAVLMKMPRGTFTFELGVFVNDEMLTSQTVTLDAEPGAADPPTDVVIAEPVVSVASDGTSGVFETRITNKGSSTITDLTLTDRLAEGTLVSEEPEPSTRLSDVSLMQWGLASFGKTSLAPGESLLLETTYGQEDGRGCGYAVLGLVVQAKVGAEERLYGSEVQQSWGNCPAGGQGGGEPVPPPSGGQGTEPAAATGTPGTEGVALPHTGDVADGTKAGLGTLAEGLAVAGVLLAVLGHAARRVCYTD